MRKRSPRRTLWPPQQFSVGGHHPPPPTLHTTQKLASMVWSPTDNFIFTFLNLPPGAISQELARRILRQLWLDSIAKWSVILHFFVLNKNNYPPGLLSMLRELYRTWDQQIQCTYMYNKIWDFRGGEYPPSPPFHSYGDGGHVHLVPYTPMKCRRGAGPDSLKWMFVFDQNLWSNKLSNVVHHMFVNNRHCCNNDGGPYRVLFLKNQ